MKRPYNFLVAITTSMFVSVSHADLSWFEKTWVVDADNTKNINSNIPPSVWETEKGLQLINTFILDVSNGLIRATIADAEITNAYSYSTTSDEEAIIYLHNGNQITVREDTLGFCFSVGEIGKNSDGVVGPVSICFKPKPEN